MTSWKCRLTLVGSERAVTAFSNSRWERTLGARHIDWLQLSPGRHVCQFDMALPPVTQLEEVSRRWTKLTLLLDYEEEHQRLKGLAKARGGQAEHHWFRY